MSVKVFLSWSGKKSHKVACALREWLPSVIQSVQPYVSSEDIDKGTRWSTDIANELEKSSYGILCITPDNLNAPWVCFEAGALSKTIDKSNVTPFLFDVKRSEIQGPLLQFQSVIFEKEELHKLLKSINKCIDEASQLTDQQLSRSFDVWWNDLHGALITIKESEVDQSELARIEKPDKDEILEEILELVRKQQRMLSEPESLIPPGYFQYLARDLGLSPPASAAIYSRIHEMAMELEGIIESGREVIPEGKKAIALARELHMLVHEIDGPRRRARRSKLNLGKIPESGRG